MAVTRKPVCRFCHSSFFWRPTDIKRKAAFGYWPSLQVGDRLVGLVVKASASRAEDPEFESRLRRDFSGSSHTSDLKIGTSVATLPGAWRCRVSAGSGWPGVFSVTG